MLHCHIASSASPPWNCACLTKCSIRDSRVCLRGWQLWCQGGGQAQRCPHRCCSLEASCSSSSPWSPPSRSSPSSPRARVHGQSSKSASSAFHLPPLRCLGGAERPQTDPASLLQFFISQISASHPLSLVFHSGAHHVAAPSARSSLAQLRTERTAGGLPARGWRHTQLLSLTLAREILKSREKSIAKKSEICAGLGSCFSRSPVILSLSLSCTSANLVSLSAAFISCRRLRNESLPFLFSVQCSGHPKTPRWAQTAPCDRSPVLVEESSAILSASLRGDHFTTLQTRALPRKCCIFWSLCCS